MQNHKNRSAVIFLCLLLPMLTGVACLSAIQDAAVPTVTVSRVTVVSPSPLTPLPRGEGDVGCVVISADEALHLRVGPDEHSRSLAFMESGEVVKLISAANVDWWRVRRGPASGSGDLVGYARSKYLEESQCEGRP